jgi:glyoxylase-like metal-dependent hydrolase (beta-lactamase superfamily II)
MQVVQETSNLYRLTRFRMVNCFLIKEEDGLTLVDTNLPGSCALILRATRKLGLPIRRIVLTHAHFDHIAALDHLAEALPNVEIAIGNREARFLLGDFSLDASEHGKKLFGFQPVKTSVTRKLEDGERVCSLRAVSSPGHTPGHFSYLECRDNTLIAGDAFTNQMGLTVAGFFRWDFPMAAWFAWNPGLSAVSAANLGGLRPSRLAVGHGKTLQSPAAEIERTVNAALKQHPSAGTL